MSTQEVKFFLIFWNGNDGLGKRLPGGVYFLRLKTDNFGVTKKLCLLKK